MGDGSQVDSKTVMTNNKVICFYFSAHWCPPCRGFTPVLAEWYNEVKKAGKAVEIIFCSSDRSEDDMKAYYADMPWMCIPHGDPRVNNLKSHFGVKGIPMLAV